MSFERLNSINIKLLRVFEVVARNRSFTRAASELSRSQATVSAQVRELEEQLEVRLIERTTRKMALTEEGAILALALTEGFQKMTLGIERAQRSSELRQGRLLIACVHSLSSVRLPSILAAYRQHDDVTPIEVEELNSSETIAAVIGEAVEFGIGQCPLPIPGEISFTSVVEEPLCALLPSTTAASYKESIPLRELATMPLVMLSGAVLLRRQIDEVTSGLQLRLKPQTEVRHVQTAIAMAAAGVGIALVPKLALPDTLRPEVALLPISEPNMVRKTGIILLRGRKLRPSAARLARFVSTALVSALSRSSPQNSAALSLDTK